MQRHDSVAKTSNAPSLADRSAFWSAIFAGGSAAIGIVSAVVAWRSARIGANVARRQALFSLDAKWADVNELVPAALVGPDVRRAVNALDITASCWHHDIVEKAIIIQSYWLQFESLYDVIAKCDSPVPGYGTRECRSFIGPQVRKAYLAMKAATEKGVALTSTI